MLLLKCVLFLLFVNMGKGDYIEEIVEKVPIDTTIEKVDQPLPGVSVENVEKVPGKVQTIITVTENINVLEINVVPEKVNISEKLDNVDVPASVEDLPQSSFDTDEDDVRTHGSYFSHNNNNNIRPTVTQNVVYVTETQKVPQHVVHVAQKVPERVVYVEQKVPQQVVHVAQKVPERVVYVEQKVPQQVVHVAQKVPERVVYVEQKVPQQVVHVAHKEPENVVYVDQNVPQHVHVPERIPIYHDKCAVCGTSQCPEVVQVDICKKQYEIYSEAKDLCTDICDTSLCQRVNQPGDIRGGCFCQIGYKRDPNGVCIPQSQCAQYFVCGAYQQFTTGDDCSDQCDKKYNCVSGKIVSRCFCVNGYKKLSNNNCVLSSQCSIAPQV